MRLGYGLVLREKLSDKWCCLSCLGTVRLTSHFRSRLVVNDLTAFARSPQYLEVCEPSLRDPSLTPSNPSNPSHSNDPPTPHSSKGKEREWDGRGAGVLGWETSEEEDLWKSNLDFAGDYQTLYLVEDETEDVLTVGELMELRYIRAEREKELVCIVYRLVRFLQRVLSRRRLVIS